MNVTIYDENILDSYILHKLSNQTGRNQNNKEYSIIMKLM